MNKFVLIAWLLCVHGIVVVALLETDLAYRIDRKLGIGWITSKELTPFYTEMVGSQQQLDGNVADGSVIFLGDSITQGLNVSAVTHPAINFGIGMDTTYGLLNRIPKYPSLKRASHIIIAIGINDLIRTHRDNDAILDNYQQILGLLPDGVPVTLQAILPVDERITMQGFNQRIKKINQRLSALARYNNAHFIDLGPEFSNNTGNLKLEYHIGDGLHLTTKAYSVWINTLKKHFLSEVKHQNMSYYQPL